MWLEDVAGAFPTIHPTNMEQNILSHPNMTLMYRCDDGYTDDSFSDEDSMPGLVNDSDDDDDEEEAEEVYQHPVTLSLSSTSANVITTSSVMNNNSEFDEEAMCKFMDELRVTETDTIEPDFIEECPICGFFIYPNDPKHIAICHLHVFCSDVMDYPPWTNN